MGNLIVGIIQFICGFAVNVMWSTFDASDKADKRRRTFWIIWGSLMIFVAGGRIENFIEG